LVGGAKESSSSAFKVSWTQWLYLLIWVSVFLCFIGPVRRVIAPPEGSYLVAGTFSLWIFIIGGLILAFSVWAEFFTDAFASFFGDWGIWIMFTIGLCLCLLTLSALFGIHGRRRKLLTGVSVSLIVLIWLQIAFAIVVFYWGWSIGDVSTESAKTLDGEGSSKWDGRLGGSALKRVESYTCNTYTLCCRDPALDLKIIQSDNATAKDTCLNSHGGATSDVQLTMQDPSQPEFCPYVSGSSSTMSASSGTCGGLEWLITGVDLKKCRAEFCPTGVEGYALFINNVVEWMQSNAVWIGTGFVGFVLIQSLWLINIWNLRKGCKQAQKRVVPTTTEGSA